MEYLSRNIYWHNNKKQPKIKIMIIELMVLKHVNILYHYAV